MSKFKTRQQYFHYKRQLLWNKRSKIARNYLTALYKQGKLKELPTDQQVKLQHSSQYLPRADGKTPITVPLIDPDLVTTAVEVLPSEFDWSTSSLSALIDTQLHNWNRRVAEDAKGPAMIYRPYSEFKMAAMQDFKELKNTDAIAIASVLVEKIEEITEFARSFRNEPLRAYVQLVRLYYLFNATLVEWLTNAMREIKASTFDTRTAAVNLARTASGLRPWTSIQVRDAHLLFLFYGAYRHLYDIIVTTLGEAHRTLWLPIYRAAEPYVQDKDAAWRGIEKQAGRYLHFVDSLMGCWEVESLWRAQARLKRDLKTLALGTENKAARLLTQMMIDTVQQRIDQLLPKGVDHTRFRDFVDVSAFARGRHISGLVEDYYALKSKDMSRWTEELKEEYRDYYQALSAAAVRANQVLNGALEHYNVRRDYNLIASVVEVSDESDAPTIFWEENDPEIKSTGVSVPQARGAEAKVRVVLPDSYSLRYNLIHGVSLDSLFDASFTPTGSIWDNLVTSARFHFLHQIRERLEQDRANDNRTRRTEWLDNNVVIAIGLVGDNMYFDVFDRYNSDARSHAMLSWRQFVNSAYALQALRKTGADAEVGDQSDPEKMHITAVIVRVYSLPGASSAIGNPDGEYVQSYETIRGRLRQVNRRAVRVADVDLYRNRLIDQTNLRAYLTFVQRENLLDLRNRDDQKRRANALQAEARRLGLASRRRPGKIRQKTEEIARAKARLSQYRRLYDAVRAWQFDTLFVAAPPPGVSPAEQKRFWEQRVELFAALHAFGPDHAVYKQAMDRNNTTRDLRDMLNAALNRSSSEIIAAQLALDRLVENEEREEEKQMEREIEQEMKRALREMKQQDREFERDLDRELKRVDREINREDKEMKREEKELEREVIAAFTEVMREEKKRQAAQERRLREIADEKEFKEEKRRILQEAKERASKYIAELRRLVGKFNEKAIILANQPLGKDWFEQQFKSSIYIPILNRQDNLCLYWAVALQMQKFHARAKGKTFGFGNWTGAKAKVVVQRKEAKDEKGDSDTDMDEEVVVFGGRDPDKCKPWKKQCYKLLRDLQGPMAGPAIRTKFPDDVIRLSEMIGYPIAVLQVRTNGKVRLVLDTIAHAPQPVAVKKRIARQLKKSREQDAAFAAALQIDPGLPAELKSGYQMSKILPHSEHIVLFYSGNPAYHFDLIQGKEIGRFMERSQTDKDRLCRHCMDIYKVGTSHKCVHARCDRCHKNNCPSNFLTDDQYYGAEKKECDQCWQFFLTDTCFAAHKKKKGKNKSVCERFKYCQECNVFYKTVVRVGGPFKESKVITQHNTEDGKSGHIHRGEVCQQCNDIMERGHECMFAKVKLPDPLHHHIGVYDTESVQPDGIHSTCLVVHSEGLATNPQHEYRKFKAMKDQKMVKSIDDYYPDVRKEKSRYTASIATENRTAAQVFVDRMLALRQERKQDAKEQKEFMQLTRTPASNFTMLGFNSSGYDLPLLLQALCHNSEGLHVSTTYHGTRLLKLVLARGPTAIKFIDANRFIPGSLARTVKTFGLEPELKAIGEPLAKGVAPFFFLQPDYSGTFPDKICFPTKDRRQPWFNDWYEEEKVKFMPHTEEPYVYMEELVKYCTQDTRILGLAVSAFREQFLKATNRQLDPFCFTTLTSACMSYYSAWHMPEHGIANLSAKVNRALRTGLYGGRVESRRMLFPVPECKTTPSDETGYRQFSPSAYLVHLDFTSLYPSVLIDELFPWGHPRWFLRGVSDIPDGPDQKEWMEVYEPLRSFDCLPYCDDLKLDDIDDVLVRFLQPDSCCMILCDYHAPDDLWDPVFPSRTQKGGNRYDLLPHKFQMVNSVELKVALDKGYIIDFIYAIAYWPPECCSRDLFTSYYSKFVVQKDQCSGWPAGCDTDEQKKDYLRAYREHPKNHGAELNPDDIEDNPGGREINKFAINSHWGRYAMADDHPHHSIYDMEDAKSRLAFYDTLFNVDRNRCISTPTIISSPDGSKAKIQVAYKRMDETRKEIDKGSPTNVAIGVFTTAHARMRLYSELEKLAPGRIFYMDTDSITLVVDPEMKDVPVAEGQLRWDELPPTGSMLGQLKWEPKPGYKIRYYGSTGRKCYQEFGTYKDEDWKKYLDLKAEGKEHPDCICNKTSNCPAFVHAKVVTKGLPETPNAEFAYHFTRVSLIRKILGLEAPQPYECHFSLLKRIPAKQSVQTIPTVRKYRLFNESSVLDPTGLTLPHGHCDTATVLRGWEESAASVQEMLVTAEEALEKVAHKAVGYQFAYSTEPGWFNPEHPEHKQKMADWERRQARRERLQKEHEERINMEEQLANQIEAAARAEGERQQELLDEAGVQLQALQDEIDRVEAEHEAAIRQYDEQREEELDPDDNEENYAIGDVEPEVNKFIADQAEGEGPGHEGG